MPGHSAGTPERNRACPTAAGKAAAWFVTSRAEPARRFAYAVADPEGEGSAQDEPGVAVEGEAGIRDT
ncbi:hypothetical protein ACFVFJ_46835 [Streptomyces sp. NPDC057717]|uniref:hypothetical protein n=1 Tax=Streptomyces sp. NPDC057717 TaxID=3346224 RepID=UPI0036C65919